MKNLKNECQLCGLPNYSHGPHYFGVCGKCVEELIKKELRKHERPPTLTQINNYLSR